MWLLKKEEPLCPCCRREFVLESLMNGNTTTGEGSGGNNNPDGGGMAGERAGAAGGLELAEARQQAQAAPQPRVVRYTPGSFSFWDSLSMNARPI